jgi:hypothetical protein
MERHTEAIIGKGCTEQCHVVMDTLCEENIILIHKHQPAVTFQAFLHHIRRANGNARERLYRVNENAGHLI